MAQGSPPPEGWEEGDHAHTPWVGMKWGSSIALEERSEVMPTFLPSLSKRDGCDHGHTHPLLKRRRAEVMTTFLPSFPFLEGRWGHGHLHLFSEGWGER